MYIEEDTTLDAETTHGGETVGLLLVSQAVAIPTQYQTRKASCNPKDLPGACAAPLRSTLHNSTALSEHEWADPR
jgi:hypothetical protein